MTALTVLALLSVVVIGASLAWACTEPGYGTPSDGKAPPSQPPATSEPAGNPAQPAPSSPSEPPPAANAAAPAQAQSSAPAQSNASSVVVSSTTSGATKGSSRPAAKPTAPARTQTTPVTGRAQLDARERGATAGVVRQGGRSVFRSSTAPKVAAKPRHAARAHSRPSPATVPAAPAVRHDVWNRASATQRPSLVAAAAAGGAGSSLGTAVVAGLAILGLGLAGLTGGFLVAADRRRGRAPAR